MLQQTGVGYLVHRGRVEQLEGIEATPLDLVEHGRQQKELADAGRRQHGVRIERIGDAVASTDGHRHRCAPADARRAPQRIEDRRHPSVSDRAAAHADSTCSSRDVAVSRSRSATAATMSSSRASVPTWLSNGEPTGRRA